jgi:phage-related protein
VQAVYYRAADGSEPVNEFIDSLTIKRQVALDNQIDRLNMLTAAHPHLPFAHSSQIEGELRELRCHYGRELYRILYRRSGNLIVLLHAFQKNNGAVSGRDIQEARERWEDFKKRMDAPRRTLLERQAEVHPKSQQRGLPWLTIFGKLPQARDTSPG